MTRKKNTRIIKHEARARKRWMHATGGSTTFKYVSLFLFGVGLLGLAAAIFAYIRSQHIAFTPLPVVSHTNEVPDTAELLSRINDERRGAGRTELENDDRLKAVAEKRLKDMIDQQQYAHRNPEGKYYYDLLSDYSYTSSYSCENLDIEPNVKPAAFIKSWLSSGGGHRECMLSDKVSKIGLASGKFSRDDKTRQDSFLVVAIFAAEPPNDREPE